MAAALEIEQRAKDFRYAVRRKAGLDGDWDSASASMKDWCRELARRSLDGSK